MIVADIFVDGRNAIIIGTAKDISVGADNAEVAIDYIEGLEPPCKAVRFRNGKVVAVVANAGAVVRIPPECVARPGRLNLEIYGTDEDGNANTRRFRASPLRVIGEIPEEPVDPDEGASSLIGTGVLDEMIIAEG